MGQTKKPRGKRTHTPVWEVLWSVRPRLKVFLPELPPAPAVSIGGTAVRTAPPSAPAPVRQAKATGTAQPQRQDAERPVIWWAKQVGKDVAIVPLKLLHILLCGYEPQAQRPQIRFRKAT